MLVTKQVERPARTVTETDYVQCDLCGAKTGVREWADCSFDVNEVNVSHSEGSSYPDGGNRTETILDICPECFKKKLIPWFVSQGGTPRTEERDY